jgi:hypothetical protein
MGPDGVDFRTRDHVCENNKNHIPCTAGVFTILRCLEWMRRHCSSSRKLLMPFRYVHAKHPFVVSKPVNSD